MQGPESSLMRGTAKKVCVWTLGSPARWLPDWPAVRSLANWAGKKQNSTFLSKWSCLETCSNSALTWFLVWNLLKADFGLFSETSKTLHSWSGWKVHPVRPYPCKCKSWRKVDWCVSSRCVFLLHYMIYELSKYPDLTEPPVPLLQELWLGSLIKTCIPWKLEQWNPLSLMKLLMLKAMLLNRQVTENELKDLPQSSPQIDARTEWFVTYH